jgi:predicted aldo/keto reductase-like oxidoreductase
MWRRTFLARSIEAAVAAFLARNALAKPAPPLAHPGERRGDMLYRPLGSTGVTVSAIGLGGFHIGQQKDEMESVRLIRAAVDRGITFLDNCWDYNGGASEERMGKALLDGYRDKVFLMTKIDGRTREAAARQIDESLKRLRTDHVDLMQVHETIRLEDPDRVFADGGAMEALVAARQAGKVRFIGFTGHKDPSVHNRMLDAAKAHGFRFDAVQMPLNVMDAHFRSFEHDVLPRLVRERIGVLGMKSMGNGILLESKTATPIECLHYALNLPTSVVITGIDRTEILDQALEAAKTFRPMDGATVRALLARTATAAATGRYELFKTSDRFDATAKHPEWLV